MVNPFNKERKSNINLSIGAYKDSKHGKAYKRYEFVHEKIKNRISKITNPEIFDIGCGDASFICYLKKKHPNAKYYGLEPNQDLIDKARSNHFLDDVKLIKEDACKFKIRKKFNIIIMSGVLSIFDEIDAPIRNMIKHLLPGGYGYIFGGFCTEDIDVLVRFRNNYLKSTTWESGLNMFSLKTVKGMLKNYASKIQMHEFKIDIGLRKQKDPIRTYSLLTQENERIIVNGANIIREFYLIEFRKKLKDKQ